MKTITIKGVDTPIHFGISTLDLIAKEQGRGFDEVLATGQNAPLDLLESILRHGLNAGARKASDPVRYTSDEVWDAIDEEPELLLRAMELFQEQVTPALQKLNPSAGNFSKPSPKPKRK